MAKRGLDFVAAAALLIVLSPLLLFVAWQVWRDVPGRIFHRRRVCRESRGGLQTFEAYKFRTMRPDADEILRRSPELWEEYAERYKLHNDPRVTEHGRVLRALGVDELPQLWNVLRGEMSLVGPRMVTPQELPKYGANAAKLLSVTPGITGWWQVNRRDGATYDERVCLDIWYIENRSLWRDFIIVCRTPFSIYAQWRSLRANRL